MVSVIFVHQHVFHVINISFVSIQQIVYAWNGICAHMCVRTYMYMSLRVTDEAAHVYEVTHTVLSGETTVSQARHQPAPPGQTAVTAGQTDSCCAAFIGCRLDKDHLKEWLRQCTVQVT